MNSDLAFDRSLYPFTSRFHVRNGLNLHYIDEGNPDAEPLVMVHGNPTWSFYYRNLIKQFRPAFRTIAVDHIGCGLSDKPGDEAYDYRLSSRIDDLESLLMSLNLKKKITLIVHDWGGAIGMGFAARHPDKIGRLMICNTFAFRVPETKRFPVGLWMGRNTCLGAVLIRGCNAFAGSAAYICAKKGLSREVRQGLLAPYNSWKNRIATLRFVQDIPLRPGDPSYAQLVEIEEALPKFSQTPMILFWGTKDFCFDRHFLHEWQRRFPNAEAHAYADCGHYIIEDAHDRIVPLLTRFLSRHPVS
jgi:haloalkane dehalogenase